MKRTLCRKTYRKDGFFSRDGLHGNCAAVGFRNLAGGGKPQSGSVFFIGDKRFEDGIDPLRRNAASGIPAYDGEAVLIC